MVNSSTKSVELLSKQRLISFPEKQEIQVKALPPNTGLLCGGCQCVCDGNTLSNPPRWHWFPVGVFREDVKGDLCV